MKAGKIFLILTVFIVATISGTEKGSLNGTWCVGEDGLVLTFSGVDSLLVSSKSDASVKGSGTYTRTDSSFTATVINGDLSMKMKYSYKWYSNDSIGAKAEFFTINEESVNYPTEWMSMKRCSLSLDPARNIISTPDSKKEDTSKNKKTNKK